MTGRRVSSAGEERGRSALHLAAILPLTVAACAGGDAGEGGTDVARSDSAGVEIVEVGHLESGTLPEWRPAGTPTVEIGKVEGPEEEQLFGIRDAARLSGGRIAVLNAGTSEVRIYDEEGSHVRSIGSEGEGPGEFRRPWRMDVVRDTIRVFDTAGHRVTVFLPDGTLVRSFSLETPGERSSPSYVGHLREGGLLGRVTRFGEGSGGADSAVVHQTVTYLTYGPDGAPEVTLASYPSQGRYVLRSETSVQIFGIPFSPRPVAAIGVESIYLGRGDAGRVDVRSPNGELVRSIRWSGPTRSFTSELVDAYVEERAAGLEDPAVRWERRELWAEIPFPETVSEFAELLVDEAGNLWIRHHALPGESETRWTVFDSTGAPVARASVPEEYEPLAIGEDWMLARHEDELEVERVRLVPLRTTAGVGSRRRKRRRGG